MAIFGGPCRALLGSPEDCVEHLGAILEQSWPILGLFGSYLGASGGRRNPYAWSAVAAEFRCNFREPILGPLGVIWGLCWGTLGPSCAVLAQLGLILGLS